MKLSTVREDLGNIRAKTWGDWATYKLAMKYFYQFTMISSWPITMHEMSWACTIIEKPAISIRKLHVTCPYFLGNLILCYWNVSAFYRPVHTSHFLLSINVNEWIDKECDECVLPQLNFRDWFTRSHPSKGETRTTNRSEIARVNGPHRSNSCEKYWFYFREKWITVFETHAKMVMQC